MKKCLILLSLVLALCLTFSAALAVEHPAEHVFHDEADDWADYGTVTDYPSLTNDVGHILFKCEFADYADTQANEFKERIVQPLAPVYPALEDVVRLRSNGEEYAVRTGAEAAIVGEIVQPTCTTPGSVTVKLGVRINRRNYPAGYPNGTIVRDGNTFYGWKGDYAEEDQTKTYVLPALGHEWSNEVEGAFQRPRYIVKTPATCTQEGEVQAYCLRCEELGEVITVEKIDHVYEEKSENTATCTAAGLLKTWEECKYCGDVKNYKEEIAPINDNHDWGIWVKNEELSVEPTCTTGGKLVEERFCKRCLTAKQIGEKTLDPLGHDLSEYIIIPATCASPAQRYQVCEREGCDYETDLENVPGSVKDPTNHPAEYRRLSVSNSKAPTCEQDGYNKYICTLCNDPAYLYTEIVPATGHDAGGKEPVGHILGSCKGEGTAPADIYECVNANCDAPDKRFTVVTGPIPAHQWTEWEERTAFQADEKGNVLTPARWIRECTVCGDTEEALRNDAVNMNVVCEVEGHDYTEWTVVTEPTCTEAGEKTRGCTRCDFTETEEIEALGHDYVAGEPVAPTCEDEGYTVYTCSRCEDSYEDDVVEALGHDYVATIYAPSCTVDGYTVYTCSVCGDSYEDDVVEAPGHDFEAVVTEPTCEEGGFTTYTCTVCGFTFVDDETEALGHDWDDGVITKEATVDEDGIVLFTCQRCGKTFEEDLPFFPTEEAEYSVEITKATDSHVSVKVTHNPLTKESEKLFARVTLITTGNTFMTMNYPVTEDAVEIDLGGALYAITIELIGTDSIVPGEYVSFDSDYYFF